MDKLKQIIVLFTLINVTLINAQQTVELNETLFVHANTTTLVSGETLLYKVYCLKSSDKTPSLESEIAYVELVDNSRKSVFKTKIKLENTVGQGDYFIPTTLKTGNYKLIAYTHWMLNKPVSELFQLDITIINPYKVEDLKATSIIKAENIDPSLTANKGNIIRETPVLDENFSFKLNKKIFLNRELVHLNIASINDLFTKGNYSLSVRKIDDLPSKKAINPIDFSSTNQKTIIDLQDKNIVLPELRGENISGKIIAKNNTDKVDNKTIALSLPGKSFAFKIVKTDSNGSFIFTIDKANYNTNIVVQLIDEHADYYTVSLDDPILIDYSKLTFPANENLSYSHKESLLNRSISSQIENAYFHKKIDNFVNQVDIDPFYTSFTKKYILDDYTRFKTLKETITEIATEINSKQIDGNYYLHVTDPNVFPQLPESALVLIDGLLLQNQNDLIKYNMKNVFKIDLISGRYYIGPKSFNGLISLTTFDKNFKSNQSGSSIIQTTILRPQLKKEYHKIDYSNLSVNERIPDYRNQLLWNPEVKLGSQNNNSFYTSDVSGQFEIVLEGFSANGKPVYLKEIIEVKDSSAN